MPDMYAVVGHSEWEMMQRFRKFANTIGEAERTDFFDPRNRHQWIRAFVEYLQRTNLDATND